MVDDHLKLKYLLHKYYHVTYGVRNIPTLLVFKNGEVVDKVVGNQPKSKLVEILESHM